MTLSTQIDMFEDPARYRDGDLPETTTQSIVSYTPFALRSSKIDEVQTRADLIKELTRQIPLNEFGLPQYYYRPDLLDVHVMVGSMKRGEAQFVDEMLQAAIIPIWYTQGFPSINDDLPVWGQLPFETKEAHSAFLAYADQEGVRTLHALTAFPPEQLREWFNLYYWPSRAKSLDMFRAAHHARLREQRIMKLEDNHFLEGEKIFKRIVRAIGSKTDEQLDELDVDKLIGALEKVAKLQRAAVGLSTTGGKEGDQTPKSSSVEVVMRKVAAQEKVQIETDEFDISLLQDPNLIDKAQELIIQVHK